VLCIPRSPPAARTPFLPLQTCRRRWR